MNWNRITLIALSIFVVLAVSGCAPRLKRWPPPVDYEQLDRKMAHLREAGVIGRRRYDPEYWALMELQLLQAEAYFQRIEARSRMNSMDILARVAASENRRKEVHMRRRAYNLAVLDRVDTSRARLHEIEERRRMQLMDQLSEIGVFEPPPEP